MVGTKHKMSGQGVVSQGAGAKAAVPSTWLDPSVNISLDFLGPGMHPPKQSQPSLNTLQHGERGAVTAPPGSPSKHPIKSNLKFGTFY